MAKAKKLKRLDLDFYYLLTEQQVANIFGVAPTTLAKWAKEGFLNPVRIGISSKYSGNKRYSAKEVEDKLEQILSNK